MASFLSTALVLTFLISVAQAAPTQTQSAASAVSPSPTVEPPFVPDPSGRGTIGLLTSCTLTLSLCVWTALHLNCYPQGTSTFKKHLMKAGWAGTALIAPEYVLWRALHQLRTARKVRDVVNEHLFREDEQRESSPERPPPSESQPDSEVNSHELQNEFADPLLTGSTHNEQNMNVERTEQQPEILGVSQPGTAATTLPLPVPTSNDHVKDDVESNQKMRWTLEHGFFAVMGGFQISVAPEYEWVLEDPERMLTPQGVKFFGKHGLLPDIRGSQLKGRGKADQLAKALVCVQAIWMVIQTISRKASGLPVTLIELNTLAHVGCAVFMYVVWWKKPQNVNEAYDVRISPRIGALLLSPSLSRFKRKSQLPHTVRYKRASNWQEFVLENRTAYKVENVFDTSQYVYGPPIQDIRKHIRPDGMVMLLTGQALEGSPFVCVDNPGRHLTLKQAQKLASKDILGGEDDLAPDLFLYRDPDSIASRASNHHITGDDVWELRYTFLFILTGLSVLYAGIHASSWNGHFPTYAEAILWRAAVCYIGASGFVLILLFFAMDNPESRTYQEVLIVCTQFLALVVLVLVRCYLVVESFISIRSLPIGSYSTVSWVNFLPHIG
jgi:hypothetical protein